MSGPTVTLTFAGDADKLSRTMNKVSREAGDMGTKVGASSERLADDTRRHSGIMQGAMSAAGGFIGNFAADGVRHLFDLSKSIEALDIKAQTVFVDQLPEIQAWAEANRKAFGDSTRNVVAMAANLADLLKPMGFTTQQATDMSKKILDLSGALSRWTGGTRSAAEVSEILADAMLGETDGLKALGISISAAEVDAKALSMGLGQTTVDMLKVQEATLKAEKAQRALSDATAKHGSGSMQAREAALQLEKAQRGVEDAMAGGTSEIDDQARALATQQLILEKSTDAQAAWENGGRAAAEAQNGMTSTMAENAEKLATLVAPVFERLVQILTAVFDWIMRNKEAAAILAVLTAAVWLLNIALNANPIVLIVTLIAGLIAALVLLWTRSETFRNIVTGVWHTIRDVVTSVVGWIIDRWNGVINFFAGIPDRVGRALGSLGNIIGSVFKGAVNVAIDGLNWMVRRLNDLIYGLNVVNPFGNIPYVPQIARMHMGGRVPGMPGQEVLTILRGGEEVSPPGGGSTGTVRIIIAGTGAMAEMFNQELRTGGIRLEADGQRVEVV